MIFPVAGLLFVLILAGLLRALLAPVYLVAMVVAGFRRHARRIGLFRLPAPASPSRIPIILYLFVTAIGTDYNILITARLREEIRDGRPSRDAAALAIAHAGPSVAAAAVILAGTFGALLVTGVPFFVADRLRGDPRASCWSRSSYRCCWCRRQRRCSAGPPGGPAPGMRFLARL